jgi:methionine aminopeptidase
MPSYAKKPAEISLMKECGLRLRKVTDLLIPSIKSGQTALSVDAYATKLLKEQGIEGSFRTVDGYRWNTCIAINEQAVHTIPFYVGSYNSDNRIFCPVINSLMTVNFLLDISTILRKFKGCF